METDLFKKLEAIERAKAPDYMFTRIQARLLDGEKLVLNSSAFRLATIASVMLILMNLYVLSQNTQESTAQDSSYSFGLNQAYQVYHD